MSDGCPNSRAGIPDHGCPCLLSPDSFRREGRRAGASRLVLPIDTNHQLADAGPSPGGSEMHTRKLGNSDLHITPVGFGAWAIGGGGWAFAWGGQDDADSIAAIHEAIDLGVNWIDTAAVYGLGHSEEVVARALEGVRDRPYVFTKCGMVWDDSREIEFRLKAASVRRECEASLKRLKVDAIDLYQIHWPKPAEDIEEGWEELAKLQ